MGETALAPYEVVVEENIWIPMADGRRLAARLWRPKTDRAVPAILEYLPYRKRNGTDPRDETTYPVFAAAGYAGVRVDIAGSGESDGLLDDEYSDDELTNGEAVIAWIAAQSWCSGAVGMIGISWGGFNGLQLAMRNPPALKAVVSVCATADRYADDIHYMGGCLLTDNMTWAAQMTAILTPPPSPEFRADWAEVWRARLEGMAPFLPMWLGHQRRDAYWQHGSLCEDWAGPRAAVLQIGGWNDAYRNTAAMVAANYGQTAKALMGPWDHKYPHIARVGERGDFHGEVIRWFDTYLKGEDAGAADLPDYRAYLETFTTERALGPRPGYWVSEPVWPSPNVEQRAHGLAVGALVAAATGGGHAVLATTPLTGQAAGNFCAGMRLENELPGDQSAADAVSVCFDSPVLEADLELLGQPEVTLTFTSDQPLAQVVARLCEVDAEGRSMLVSYRPFNLTHRHGHDVPEPLPVGETVTLRFPLNQLGHAFAKGHRIRLALSNGYWPLVWPSPVPAQLQLDLAGCALHLPVRTSGTRAPEAVAPARPYPTRAYETLEAPSGAVHRATDGAGVETFETWDDFGRDRDRATGTISHVTVKQRFTYDPARPESPEVRVTWEKDITTTAGQTKIRTEVTLTSDLTDFQTDTTLTAWADGAEVFHKTHAARVKRDFI